MCKPKLPKPIPPLAPPAPPEESAQLDTEPNERVEARRRNRRGTRALTIPLGLSPLGGSGLGGV